MEDYGYQKEAPSGNSSQFVRKLVLLLVALVSISGFVYFTVSAYQSLQGDSDKVLTIKSPEFPIKVVEDDYQAKEDESSSGNRQIYEDIFGNKQNAAKNDNPKIRNIQEPINPTQESRSIKKSEESAKIVATATNSNLVKLQTKPAVESISKNKEILAKNSDEKFPEKKISGQNAVESRAGSYDSKNSQSNKANSEQKKNFEIIDQKSGKENEVRKANQMVEIGLNKPPETNLSKPSSKKRAIRVQISAMSSQDLAEENWQKISRENPSIFNALKHFIVKADLGKRGIFYRLQIGEFYNQVAAEEFCTKFVAKAQKTRADCIIVE